MKASSIGILVALAGLVGVGGVYAAKYLNPGSQKILDPGSTTTRDPGSSTTKTPEGKTITKAQRLADLQKKKDQIEGQLKSAQDTLTRVKTDAQKLCSDLRNEFEPKIRFDGGRNPTNDQVERECMEFIEGIKTLSAQKFSDLSRSKNKGKAETLAREYKDALAKISSNESSLKPIQAEISKLESEGVL
jgi:TolA-binding protein